MPSTEMGGILVSETECGGVVVVRIKWGSWNVACLGNLGCNPKVVLDPVLSWASTSA